MNVGFVTASLSRNAGGIYDATRLLARELQRLSSYTVDVFGLEDSHTRGDVAGWGQLRPHVFPTIGPQSVGFAPGLGKALKQADLTLLHTHGLWMYPSRACLSWARSRGGPYVISPHGMLDSWALRNSRWKKWLASWLYEKAHLEGASCIHALCDAERHAIRGYGLENPVCVIPNGIEMPGGEVVGRPDWWQRLPERSRVLLYLGRIHPKKGLENLLRAWKHVRGGAFMKEPWCLVIAGWDQGGHEAELKSLAASLGITDGTFFIGPQYGAAKQASYAHADAFVLPSFSEGLPMVVLEAWAHGLPVIMTPQCNLPEGFVARAAIEAKSSVDGVSAALGELVRLSDEDRTAMGKRGRMLVEERFTWSRVAGDMASVYHWLVHGGDRPSCVFTD